MGSIRKQLLDANRVRTIPEEGFSWIDRRFLRHGFSHLLSSTEILLYWFLCSVADKHGLSYYSDRRISTILKLSPGSIDHARQGLIRRDLVLYRAPLYQVLALPCSSARGQKVPSFPAIASSPRRSSQPELRPIREILRELL
jgi:Helix-turn-helix domain